MKHTQLPWTFAPKLSPSENHRGFIVRAVIPERYGAWNLADIQPGDEDGNLGKSNAQFIVRACNSHYELLEALKAIVQSSKQGQAAILDDLVSQVNAAIAKAEGEE